MKKILLLILIFTFAFSSCIKPETPETTTETPVVFATDVDGEYVPVHEDVNESALDPKLFSKNEKGRMEYADESVKLLTGVDVSTFQGDIDWEKVASDGIDYAILRVGFRGYGSKGIMQLDERFFDNYNGAIAAGLDVGVYFYSQAITPEEAVGEAEFVLTAIEGLDIKYPIVFDWEYVNNDDARTKDMTAEGITKCAKAFCERIESAGRKPVIYFNCSLGYFEYNLAEVKMYDFWLAEYNHYPTLLYDYKMWQYTEKGSVDGIEGNVDLNISVVDYAEETESFG